MTNSSLDLMVRVFCCSLFAWCSVFQLGFRGTSGFRKCLTGVPPKLSRTKFTTTVLCGCSNIDTWIIAQGSMSNANICERFHCSKKVEKHRPNVLQEVIGQIYLPGGCCLAPH